MSDPTTAESCRVWTKSSYLLVVPLPALVDLLGVAAGAGGCTWQGEG